MTRQTKSRNLLTSSGNEHQRQQFHADLLQITAFAPHMVPFLKSPPHQHQDRSSPNAIPPSSGQSIKPPTPSFSRMIECYFCGEKGHGARQCGQAENMITAGSIVRGDSGRITWSDGTTIIRVGNKTIQAAVNQELGNRNKSARMTSYIRQGLPFEDSFSDDEDKADIIVKNGQVYAAVKPKDDKKPRKKDHKDPKKRIIFDGVEIPKSRPPVKEEIIPAQDPHIIMPPPWFLIRQKHPYDPQDDDVFMEDVAMELPEMDPQVVKKKKKLSLKTRPDGAPLTVKPEHFDLRHAIDQSTLTNHRRRRNHFRRQSRSSNPSYSDSWTWMSWSPKY